MERAPRTAAEVADPTDIRGQMDDRVGVGKETLGDLRIAQVAITAPQRPDLDTATFEARDNVRPEEPPGAGDVDLHHIPLRSLLNRQAARAAPVSTE